MWILRNRSTGDDFTIAEGLTRAEVEAIFSDVNWLSFGGKRCPFSLAQPAWGIELGFDQHCKLRWVMRSK